MQRRIALFAKVCCLLNLLFGALLWLLTLVVPELANRDVWANVLTSAALLLVLGGTWFVASRRRLGTTGLWLADSLPMLVVAVLLAVSGIVGWQLEPQRYGVLVAAAMVAMARVFVVPSSWQRTLFISLILSAGPGFAATYRAYVPMAGVEASAWGPLSASVLWGVVSSILAAFGSRIIFGLHREIRVARELGQYTLQTKLGEGGMGQVYLAKHRLLRRPTAIKLLPLEKAGGQAISRFEREVQLTATLKHPNTVSIFDYGRSAEGVFYYAMEYLEGMDLATLVQVHGPQPVARVVHILRQVASALAEAHGKGLIHRDVKPANVILTNQGGEPDFVKVVDFGLVKDLAADTQLTLGNGLTGTPAYLAPETLTDPEQVDARSDIYAVGAMAYYLVTGSDVFVGTSVVDVLSQHLNDIPRAPSERMGEAIDPDFEALVLQCLSKHPEARPGSAMALRDRLDSIAEREVWSPKAAEEWWSAWEGSRRNQERGVKLDSKRETRHLTVGLRGSTR